MLSHFQKIINFIHELDNKRFVDIFATKPFYKANIDLSNIEKHDMASFNINDLPEHFLFHIANKPDDYIYAGMNDNDENMLILYLNGGTKIYSNNDDTVLTRAYPEYKYINIIKKIDYWFEYPKKYKGPKPLK